MLDFNYQNPNTWDLTTLNLNDGSLVYSESNIGGYGNGECLLTENNNFIIASNSYGYCYDIFDGSYDSNISYYVAQDDNPSLLSDGNTNVYKFYKNDNNYYVTNQQIGSSGSSNIFEPISMGNGDHFAFKTDSGYTLCIGYTEQGVSFNDQFLIDNPNGQQLYLILDLDNSFNITSINNFVTTGSISNVDFSVSKTSKSLFISCDGDISINNQAFNGLNHFILLF